MHNLEPVRQLLPPLSIFPGRTRFRPMACSAGACFVALLAAGWSTPRQAAASPPSTVAKPLSDEKPAEGQPKVVLDRLDFPRDILGAPTFKKHLERSLRREAYRADWGAGRENRIEYRFEVTQLNYTLVDGALRAHCTAVGRLPGGQTAKSQLTFSGHPSDRVSLTKRVLDIVARGVITRLAELERKRRGLR